MISSFKGIVIGKPIRCRNVKQTATAHICSVRFFKTYNENWSNLGISVHWTGLTSRLVYNNQEKLYYNSENNSIWINFAINMICRDSSINK